MRYISLILSILLYASTIFAQSYYWVEFTDKSASPYSINEPEKYLSNASIERRIAQNIAIDSTDLPVNPQYINAVRACGAQYVHQSKWLNGITIIVNNQTLISEISQLPFVKSVKLTHYEFGRTHFYKSKYATHSDVPQYEVTHQEQHQQIGLSRLHDAGFRGKGRRIAILDTGYPKADTDPELANINIKSGHNISYPTRSVYDSLLHHHGTLCLSIMAADIADKYTGSAPDATYYLFVTEINESESLLELDHWVRAAEMADSIGVDIITTSLGYSEMDDSEYSFTYSDMNGKTTHCSRAAALAAQKGMVVCVSAGNEANKPWHYITSPADADGIISVGGVDVMGYHSSFSSYGPTADGRIKPTVCARGTGTAIYYNGTTIQSNGTSFATPIIAGAAASLWSALPDLTAKEITQRIIETASQYNNPDNTLGYGIANVWYAYSGETALNTTESDKEYIINGRNPMIVENKSGHEFIIRIYNISGQLIYQSGHKQQNHSINTNNYPKGVYIIFCNNGKQTMRHIIAL